MPKRFRLTSLTYRQLLAVLSHQTKKTRLQGEINRSQPEIKDQLFSGKGGELQYQDSQIAEYVFKDMQARGQPVLPVHDSFIVQDKYLAHLYSSMKEAYRMLGIDSIPEVKIKKGTNTTYDKPYFMQLWELMDAESKVNQKELESIKKLEDLL